MSDVLKPALSKDFYRALSLALADAESEVHSLLGAAIPTDRLGEWLEVAAAVRNAAAEHGPGALIDSPAQPDHHQKIAA